MNFGLVCSQSWLSVQVVEFVSRASYLTRDRLKSKDKILQICYE